MARKLTGKQEKFIIRVSQGHKPAHAAKLADFAFPEVEANRLMQLPHIREAIRTRRDRIIEGDLAGMALETMRDLMGGDTPAATRYQASKWVLEHAGHRLPGDGDAQGAHKPLDEMNADELSRAIESGMSALGELAGKLNGSHPVDGEWREVKDVQTIEHDDADFLG